MDSYCAIDRDNYLWSYSGEEFNVFIGDCSESFGDVEYRNLVIEDSQGLAIFDPVILQAFYDDNNASIDIRELFSIEIE